MPILHPTRRLQALLPAYTKEFGCIGAACEDSCCSGWDVDLDRKTFTAYRRAKHPHLQERFETRVRRNRAGGHDAAYGEIVLDPATLACPFVEERLCAIQKTLGEDHLSDTCASFPRYTRSLGGVIQQALTLSCPEAARLALLRADAFLFETGEIVVRPNAIANVRMPQGLSADTTNEVRFFCLQLVQGEGLELWQKLAVLGLFCESLTKALQSDGVEEQVQQALREVRTLLQSGEIARVLDAMEPFHDVQAVAYALLLTSKPANRVSPRAASTLGAIASGLGIDAKTGLVPQEQVVQRYVEGTRNLGSNLAEAPHLLQNYVLNELVREVFPFDGPSPYDHFLRIVTRYGMVRFMLAALSADARQPPRLEDLVQAVQVFCRWYQHDIHFSNNVNQSLRKAGWERLDRIYRFLRA